MNTQFTKPKEFGEILDHTFRISKNHFKDFFLIFLLVVGPVYLLQAIMELASGTSFFREIESGGSWLEQFIYSLEVESAESANIAADIGVIIVGLLTFLLYPIAQASILFGVNHLRKNEQYTAGTLVKQAFSRFWPMIGSCILFTIILIFIIAAAILTVSFTGFFLAVMNPIVGILVAVILALGLAVFVGYFLTRWSFYFGSVVLDKESPGFTRSWRLSKGRTFVLMGLYIIFFLIISSISAAVEFSLIPFLGNSVLVGLIVSFVSLFTTYLMSVGYAVMYLDLKTRHDADDLIEMIDDYHAG